MLVHGERLTVRATKPAEPLERRAEADDLGPGLQPRLEPRVRFGQQREVVSRDGAHLTAADELTLADLAGEVVIVPEHPPLDVAVAGAVPPRFAPPATVGQAIETVAAGVGVVIVPMSLARLHHRKDITSRLLTDGPVSPVALAWPEGETPPLVEAFIGIVRGRTANSSR